MTRQQFPPSVVDHSDTADSDTAHSDTVHSDTAECFDVAIVGFGPTGATLASLLAQRGCRVVVVETSPLLNPDPRASFFDGDSLRVWQQLGIGDEIAGVSIPLPGLHFRNADGDLILDWPMPSTAGTSSWPASNLLHQPVMEAILRRRAEELGAIVRLGEHVLAISQTDEYATLLSKTTTGVSSIRARFVVGCDGGSSTVRSVLGFAWDDFDCTLHWRLADVEITGPSELLDVTTAVMDPAGPRMVGHLAHNRYRWLWLQPGGNSGPWPEPADVLTSLSHGVGPHNALLTRQASYVAHARVSQRWSAGRVFVAGDAAHQLPPLLGQGIGAGVRDVANLAWKLAHVLAGQLPFEVLDSYECERKFHAAAVVKLSAAISSYVFTWDPALAAERDARLAVGDIPLDLIPMPVSLGASPLHAASITAGSEFPQWMLDDGVRTDDLLGDAFALVVLPRLSAHADRFQAQLFSALGVDLTAWQTNVARNERLDQIAEPWLTTNQLAAVLIRPDRMVACCVGLASALSAALPAHVGDAFKEHAVSAALSSAGPS